MTRLAITYPSSLWAGDDYSLEYLAAACNAGARLNDLVMYKTGTMAYRRAASGLAPAFVVALVLYFATTPQSIFRSVYPLTETFALAVNALFLLALVSMAKNP